MKLLKCKVCGGEVNIIGGEHNIVKKIKCVNFKCGFSNISQEPKEPEIIIIRKRNEISRHS